VVVSRNRVGRRGSARGRRWSLGHGLALLGVAAVVASVGAGGAGAGTVPLGFTDSVVFSGLNEPTSIAFAPDGKVFVGEKSGIIKVYSSLSATTPTVFADLRTETHNWWDRGLESVAVDPNFPTNPYVYVSYTYDAKIGGTAPTWGTPGATDDTCPTPPGQLTPTGDGCLASGRLARLTFDPNTSQMVPGSEDVLINDWCVQYNTHSLGHVAFGPDGMLYVSGGDGGSADSLDWGQFGGTQPNTTDPLVPKNPCGDPPAGVGGNEVVPTAEGGVLRSQSPRRPAGEPRSLDGTIIRVDPSTGLGLASNPFGSSTDANAKRIIAYGLRNPFRWTFRPGTSEIWIGNVGADTYESIDRDLSPTAAAPNFGWPCYEGPGPMTNGPHNGPGYQQAGLNLCTTLYNDNSWTPPYFTYHHFSPVSSNDTCSPNVSGTAITGIDFYNGTSYPAAYHNALFFGDYARNCIWVMPAGTNGLPDPTNVSTFDQGASSPVDIETGPNGDLFYVDINGGTVHRITFGSSQTGAPQNTSPPTVTGAAQAGQTLTEDDGTWSGTAPIAFSRQWLRCSGTGAGCAPISGAAGTSYTLTSTEVGSTIRVSVTATNSVGNASAQSGLTAIVAASGSPVSLGNTFAGSLSDTGWNGLKWGNKYVLTVQGTFTKVSAYLADNPSVSGTESLRAAIYADSSGAPGALKAQTSAITIPNGQAAGWVDFPISPSVVLPAGTYWIVLQGGATDHGALRYGTSNNTAGAEAWNSDAFSDGLANPFGAANTGSWVWSLYATFTTSTSSGSAPQNTSPPVVSGTPQQAQSLTETDGSWTGSPAPTFTRQWQRCASGTCQDISGATGTSYTLVAADVGSTIRVAVTGTNTSGASTAFSAQTATVTSSGGTSTLGNTTVGALSDTGWNGLKWGNKYTLAAQGTFSKVSAYLGDNPAVTGAESFRAAIYADASGSPGALKAQSSAVAVTDGQAAGWVDFPISPGVTLSAGTYWIVLQGGTTDHGALRYGTSNNTAGAEAWNSDAFSDGLTDPFGTSASGAWVWSLYATFTTSSGSSAPQNTSPPVVSGTPQQGQSLTETDGSWTGSPAPTFTRQWQRCTSGTCSGISGATGTSYTLVAADVGSTIRVAVTGTNTSGSSTAFSAQTATITPSSTSTLGNTTVGSLSDTGWNGLKWGNKYALATQGTFTKISAYLGDNPSVSTPESFRAAIYADASGAPGALKAQSSVVTIANGQAAGWVDFTISPGVTLPAGTYWIVLQGGTTDHGALRYGTSNSTTGAEAWNSDAFSDGLSDPFGAVNSGAWIWSLYGTYS
jgi:glucose/arabinose dehydrogenase